MPAALKIEKLIKSYSNGVQALKGIDLEVQPGDFFALLGPNGAGKSTAIGIISSLVNKSSGRVCIFDHDIDLQPSLAKSFLGLVPQEFNFNVFEPIFEVVVNQAGFFGIDRKTAAVRARYYLEKLQLWEKREDSARLLSGGMKRRLMIARALVNKPKLLILDEPTAGVDVEIRHSMWSFLEELNQNGTTIILTTHYLEEAERLCKNIAIINNGLIVENSSMSKLLAQLSAECYVLDVELSSDIELSLPGIAFNRVSQQQLDVNISTGGDLHQLFAYLSEKKLFVKSIRNKQNRLEQLFLALVNDRQPTIT
ncbi:MAG: ABC transporter ATP-binding protein [Thiohalomonadales bacterium]